MTPEVTPPMMVVPAVVTPLATPSMMVVPAVVAARHAAYDGGTRA